MTRLGKIARLPREIREELSVRLRWASAFAKATADKPTRQVRLHKGGEGKQFKAQIPGLNLDGLGNSAKRPPQELRACPETEARRLAQTGLGESRDLAEAPIKANQTKSNQIKPNQNCEVGGDGSGQWPVDGGWWRKRPVDDSAVKLSQTESNHSGSRMGVVSGQWAVASGWWREGWGKTVRSNPVKASQTSQTQSNPIKPVKPSQTQSNQSNPVKPGRTRSNHTRSRARRSQNKLRAARFAGCSPLPKWTSPIKPNQTKSNLLRAWGVGLPEAKEGGGRRSGQTWSNSVKPV